jgi:serine-type D-Ala-D-Ala endopeptidase (penicillin-binding protein 7)
VALAGNRRNFLIFLHALVESRRRNREEVGLGWGARLAGVVLGIAAMMAMPVRAAAAAATSGPHATGGSKPAGSAPARPGGPNLKSNVALVIDSGQGTTLYAKHADRVAPIASITKLMTAMVVLDTRSPLDEAIEIDRADVDTLKRTRSRLPVGAWLSRGELLRLALMASENRAAVALARAYPGGKEACVEAMNLKAWDLGMIRTRFTDPAGLSAGNVSSAEDLSRLVQAARVYPEIREATTSPFHRVTLADGRALEFRNSDGLVNNETWNIGLSKTGYINEAGRCLVLQAEIAARQVVIVLLDSWGKYTRLGDANRIRKWIEATVPPAAGTVHQPLPPLGAPG